MRYNRVIVCKCGKELRFTSGGKEETQECWELHGWKLSIEARGHVCPNCIKKNNPKFSTWDEYVEWRRQLKNEEKANDPISDR